jgi:hypothetical protein
VDFYKIGPKSRDLFSRKNTTGKEINLREELSDLLIDTEKNTWFLYRRVRLDERDLPVKHPEVFNNRNGEIIRDTNNHIATNNGNLFDDYVVPGYLNHAQSYSMYNRFRDPGEDKTDSKTAYFKYDFLEQATGIKDAIPKLHDKIYLLKLDIEGAVISPLEVQIYYDILSIDSYRLDSRGRIEYYRFRLVSVTDESSRV